MRLKRVKIFGFKTFADRTEFDLEGNLIAVVGPNGCGKSNLVDAILWGLGEGNARHLRAQNNQDVIFSGSSRRKGVGFAEVTLLFDNEDGALPLSASEVSVTRRLNRSGDSEYFINRQACRLRDVLDLLADSGLGRAGYSIVGQKEIDQALAASADDRRAWLDEAAGVQRYRARKVESLRRLQSAQSHLDRVTDILSELEAQREPLRQDAEVATRYKSLLHSLQQVESGLLIVEVAKATNDVAELELRIKDSLSLAAAETLAAEHCDEEVASLGSEVRAVESNIERVRGLKESASSQLQRAESGIQLAEQKLSTLEQLETNLGEEAEIASRRIEEAQTELSEARAEHEAEGTLLDRIRIETGGACEEAKDLTLQLKTIEQELAIGREAHNRSLKLQAERAQIEERQKALRRELQGIDSSLPQIIAANEEAQKAAEVAKQALLGTEAGAERAQALIADFDRNQTTLAGEARKLLSEKAALEGRKQGIEATIEAHEGLSQGARAVLEARKRGELTAEYVPVGEALTVRKEHALAIETALGGAVHDLIVEQEIDAKAAIELLKSKRLGRATFQPIPLMRSRDSGSDLQKLLSQPCVLGKASELVTCDGKFRPVLDSLLSRVVVVDNIDSALRLAKTTGWSKLVTLEGEIVHGSGAVSGGQSGKSSYGLVQRKADLADVAQQIKRLEAQLRKAEEQLEQATNSRAKLVAGVETKRAELKELQQNLADARQFAHAVQHELTTTERAKAKIAADLEQLGFHAVEAVELPNLADIEAHRDALVRKLAVKSADADSAAEKVRDAQARVQQAATRLDVAERRVAAAHENEQLRRRKLTNLGPDREKAKLELARCQHELAQATSAKENAENELRELQQQRADLIEAISARREQARSARSHAQTATETGHQAEVARARIETRRAASAQRLLEEYGINEEQALTDAPAIELPSDALTVVNRLRRDIKSMGDVNVGAVEAYERLTERWDELTVQQEDVVGGIRQVEASIRELDKLTRERFVSTFEQVQVAFSEMFVKLFGGGEGRIYLTDESNILESGVEIDVMLPGKKRQRLELLSGGERSLCGASFLFALLRVKPSPLVVLDEVDAPLDGRNVERFLSTLHEFAEISQFILITHNPTTIESAPVWLGVTMQEPGVSTLVPARFAPTHAVVSTEREPVAHLAPVLQS